MVAHVKKPCLRNAYKWLKSPPARIAKSEKSGKIRAHSEAARAHIPARIILQKGVVMSNAENNFLSKVPENIQLSVMLIFKIAIFI